MGRQPDFSAIAGAVSRSGGENMRTNRPPPKAPPPQSDAADDNDRRSARALDMSAFVPAALTFLAQKISTSASAIYRPRYGVGITDWRVMALLAAEPWIAPVRISEATGLDKAAVSRSLRDLAARGLVEIGDRGENRRRLPVALTRKGLTIHDELVKIALAREALLLEGFSPKERTTLQDLLARMQRQVDALDDGGRA
jgi:DNA-binding MarR family transcriptional regulator